MYYTQYMYMDILYIIHDLHVHILYIYTCISATGLVTSPSLVAVEMLYIIVKSGGYFNIISVNSLSFYK